MFYGFENVKHEVCSCNVTTICQARADAPRLRNVDVLARDAGSRRCFEYLSGSLPAGRRAIFCAASKLSFLFFSLSGRAEQLWPLLLLEHQVQILHRGAGRAFTQIVENRGEQNVLMFRVRKYA